MFQSVTKSVLSFLQCSVRARGVFCLDDAGIKRERDKNEIKRPNMEACKTIKRGNSKEDNFLAGRESGNSFAVFSETWVFPNENAVQMVAHYAYPKLG